MEQSQVMRAEVPQVSGLHEDKRSWEESHRLAPGGAAGSQEKVRCRRGQDKTGQEAKIGKRRGSGGEWERKRGLKRCECEC